MARNLQLQINKMMLIHMTQQVGHGLTQIVQLLI